MLRFVFVLLTVSFVLSGNAQEKSNYYLRGMYHNGFIIDHSKYISPLIKAPAKTYTFSISKQHYGTKDWHRHFRFPETGLGINLTDFGNPDILGTAFSVYYFIHIPIFRTDIINLHYQLGIGGSFHPKHFGNTPENTVIAGVFNDFLNGRIDLRVNMLDDLQIFGGVGFLHYSNGRVKIPNIGINILAYHAGILYFIENEEREFQQKKYDKFKGKNEFSVIQSLGYKEISPAGGPKYLAGSLVINYERHLTYKRKAGFGLDVFYDNSLFDEVRKMNADTTGLRHSDFVSLGVHVSQDFIMNKVTFTSQFGHYLRHTYPKVSRIYWRFGLRYYFHKKWFAKLSLKAHYLAKADFFEFGFGYRIIR